MQAGRPEIAEKNPSVCLLLVWVELLRVEDSLECSADLVEKLIREFEDALCFSTLNRFFL